jgi:hypothetical protein
MPKIRKSYPDSWGFWGALGGKLSSWTGLGANQGNLGKPPVIIVPTNEITLDRGKGLYSNYSKNYS